MLTLVTHATQFGQLENFIFFNLLFLIQNSLNLQTNRIVLMGCSPCVENVFAMPTRGKMVEPFCVTRIALSPFNPPQTFPRNIDLKHSRQPAQHNETPGARFCLSETPRTRWVLKLLKSVGTCSMKICLLYRHHSHRRVLFCWTILLVPWPFLCVFSEGLTKA